MNKKIFAYFDRYLHPNLDKCLRNMSGPVCLAGPELYVNQSSPRGCCRCAGAIHQFRPIDRLDNSLATRSLLTSPLLIYGHVWLCSYYIIIDLCTCI